MRYVTLKPQYALRGWSDLPYGLLDMDCQGGENRVVSLTGEQSRLIELLTSGNAAIDEPLLPEAMRRYAQRALKTGWFMECRHGKALEDYQRYRRSEARYTHTLLWSITGRCNLACRHCYVSSGTECFEPDFDQCVGAMEQMLEANVHMVALSGGEPLVRRDFFRIVDELLKRRIRILQVFTNGLLVNERFLSEFEEREIHPNCFLLSFDGVGCHDWLRGRTGAERAAVDAIRLLKRRGYRLVVSTVLHMGNIHALLGTYQLMKELGVDCWKAVPVVDTGKWREQEKAALDIDWIYGAYLALLERYAAGGAPLRLGLGGFFQCNQNDLSGWHSPAEGCKGACDRQTEPLCETARHFPYLTPDGRVLPCIAMSGSALEDRAPNIFSEGMSLAKALNNSLAAEYAQMTYGDLFEKNKECGSCQYRLSCSGCRANALSCGEFLGKDPLACRFFKGGYSGKIRSAIEKGMQHRRD